MFPSEAYSEKSKVIVDHYKTKEACQSLQDLIMWESRQADLFYSRKSTEDVSYAFGIASGPNGIENYTTYSDTWYGHHSNQANKIIKVQNRLKELRLESEETLKELQERYPDYCVGTDLDLSFKPAELFLTKYLIDNQDLFFSIDLNRQNTGAVELELDGRIFGQPTFARLLITFYPNYSKVTARINLFHVEWKDRKKTILNNHQEDASVESCLAAYKEHVRLKYDLRK